MRNVNKVCMSILMLGAAAFAAPALAQSGDAKADASEQAAPDQSAASAPAQANESANANPNSSAGPAAATESTQTAMNSSSAAASNANVSSVGDTSKKYHRATRGKDFAAEQKVTQQLNQMASNAAKPGVQTAMNQ